MKNFTSTKVQNLTYLLLKHNFFPDIMEKQMNEKKHHFKLFLLLVFCAFTVGGKVSAQFHTPTINATLGTSEYGTNNANNYVTGSTTWYSTWNDTDLYFFIQNANQTEPVTIYLDVDPITVVNGGSAANGTLVGLNYDGYTTRPNLPFRADIAIYCHNTYREIFRRDSSNGWTSLGGGNGLTGTANDYTSAATGQYSSNDNSNGNGSDDKREFRISWARLLGTINGGLRPSSFNWMGYVSYNNGMYGQVPVENHNGGNVTGNSNGIVRYFTVSSTADGSSTSPFSRNSYTQPLTATNNSFGAISVHDFTMNSSGQQISRLNSGGDWTIGGTLTVGAGTIFFGSGGSGYGNTTVGNLNVAGGTLNMNQTNKIMNVTGNVTNTGTLTLSSTIGGDLSVQGNITDNGTFNANNRAIFFSGTNVQEIQGSGVFDIAYVRINKAGGRVRMLTNLTCQGPNGSNAMELNSATSILDLNGFTLNLGQTLIASTFNSGVLTPGVIRGSSSSNLNIFGTGSLGTINFDQSSPGTTNALQNLTIERTSTGTVTLGNAVRVDGTFTIKSGSNVTVGDALVNNGTITVDSGGTLTLTGTITNSGMINNTGTITNSGTIKNTSTVSGTGYLLSTSTIANVTQERYLSSNQRGWRLLSNPLSTITFGTLATGASTPNTTITLGANASGAYNSVANTWSSGTDSDNMVSQQAYKVFVRGRASEVTGLAYSVGTPSNVTLSISGTATNTAPATVTTTLGQFYLVANPYTAPVSLSSILGMSSGLSNSVSYYNPSQASTDVKVKAGGYNVVSVSGSAGSATDVVLPPMGAIFVQAFSAGSIVVPKTAIFTGTPLQAGTYNHKTAKAKATTNALNVTVMSGSTYYDALNLQFKALGDAGTNIDFGKLNNEILDFYSINGSNNMAVSELELTSQIIPLGITSTVQKSYTLHVAENTIPAGFEAELIDNYTSTTTALAPGTNYNFSIDSNAASQGNARFTINLKTAGTLSVVGNELDPKIKLWPNPAHNQFTILNSIEGVSTIEISNLNGQAIHSQPLLPGTTTIQTKGWATGVYILKATNNGAKTIKKLIIQ